jgi:hypothetical protein
VKVTGARPKPKRNALVSYWQSRLGSAGPRPRTSLTTRSPPSPRPSSPAAAANPQVYRTHTIKGGFGRDQDKDTMKYNKRGSDDDRRQIIADLISSDDSPFTPDDEEALRMSRDAILHTYRDAYLKPKKAKAKAQHRTNCLDGIAAAELGTMVANAVAAAFAGNARRTRSDERADSARRLLLDIGVADPSDDQVAAVVKHFEDAAGGAGKGEDEDTEAMAVANTTEAMAREAELRGNADHARKLRKLASKQAEAARRHAAFIERRATEAAVARRLATNAVTEDEDVRAMSEFHGDAALARALASKSGR